MLRSSRGFTLIELMIVVAIIAILAAIALPTYTNYRKTAAETACLAETKAYANFALVMLFDNTPPPAPPMGSCSAADTAAAIGTNINATPRLPGTRTTTCSMDGTGGDGRCWLN